MNLKSALAFLLLTPALLCAAESAAMYPCSIQLPNCVLRFSLPEGNVRSLPPQSVRQISAEGVRLSSSDLSLQRNGFKSVFEWLYDFRSMFGFEAYGSLKMTVMVRVRSPQYLGQIETVEELHRYLRQQTDPKYGFSYEHVVLNGVDCTRRFRNTFGEAVSSLVEKGEELELFSFPLGDQMFLQVGFNVMEWVPGKGKLWRDKAIKLREEIKMTIALEK